MALVVRLDSWLLLSGSNHELNVRHKDDPSSFPKAGLCLHVLLSIHRVGRPDIRWRDLSRKYDGGRQSDSPRSEFHDPGEMTRSHPPRSDRRDK